MWRKIAKTSLWFSVIVVELLVLFILTPMVYKLLDDNFLAAFLTVVAGTAINAVVHSFLGATLDCFSDVNYIRNNIKGFSAGQSSESDTSTGTLSSIERLRRINNGESTVENDFWFCTACGEKNKKLDSICKSCGKYK